MPDSKTNTIALLGSTSAVDMKTTAAKTTLYTVPTGKTAYIVFVIIRDPSASMAGGTEYDFGTDATCTTWRQNVNLSDATVSGTDFIVVGGDSATAVSECAAASAFGIYPVTGTTATCTAAIDVFGYLI